MGDTVKEIQYYKDLFVERFKDKKFQKDFESRLEHDLKEEGLLLHPCHFEVDDKTTTSFLITVPRDNYDTADISITIYRSLLKFCLQDILSDALNELYVAVDEAIDIVSDLFNFEIRCLPVPYLVSVYITINNKEE